MTTTNGPRTLLARAASTGLLSDRTTGRTRTVATTVRIAGGLLFILSAIPKITAHQDEIDMFGRFGLPRSSLLVYLVAALEITSGLLLLLGLLTRLAAAAMAANMTGAVLTAGTHVGGPVHLGLAPALLAAMLYVLWAGPGNLAVDRHLSYPKVRPR